MTTDAASLPYRPCVGVTLINPQGLIWAGRRLDSTADAWQMPQGGIDADEKPRAAALRELQEETGIGPDRVTFVAKTHHWLTYDLPPELLGKVWGGKYRGQRQKWFLFRFAGQDSEVDINRDHPEFAEWRWIAAGELLERIVPFKREVYDKVIKSFRAYL
jgi:putative (di)nucleoside polyphosphate hydrolase